MTEVFKSLIEDCSWLQCCSFIRAIIIHHASGAWDQNFGGVISNNLRSDKWMTYSKLTGSVSHSVAQMGTAVGNIFFHKRISFVDSQYCPILDTQSQLDPSLALFSHLLMHFKCFRLFWVIFEMLANAVFFFIWCNPLKLIHCILSHTKHVYVSIC